jgi:hypothetical protein
MKMLILDVETSGISQDTCDMLKSPNGKYQIIAIGALVVDYDTLDVCDDFYVDIKWDSKSTWDKSAEDSHGVTIEYLCTNGVNDVSALEQFAGFLIEHFDGQDIITCGCNVGTIDVPIINQLFTKYGLPSPFSHKVVDLNSIGYLFGITKTTELFDIMECHLTRSALNNCVAVLSCLKKIKKILRLP